LILILQVARNSDVFLMIAICVRYFTSVLIALLRITAFGNVLLPLALISRAAIIGQES